MGYWRSPATSPACHAVDHGFKSRIPRQGEMQVRLLRTSFTRGDRLMVRTLPFMSRLSNGKISDSKSEDEGSIPSRLADRRWHGRTLQASEGALSTSQHKVFNAPVELWFLIRTAAGFDSLVDHRRGPCVPRCKASRRRHGRGAPSGLVAQLGEHCVRNAEVVGSTPIRSTTWGRSSVGRAAVWQTAGQGFDSPRFHHSMC